MIYHIPKNIKVKKEIFKGYGLLEIILIVIGLIIGYLLSLIPRSINLKLLFGGIFPIGFILLTLPLSNGLTILKLMYKFLKYNFSQKMYMCFPGTDKI